MKLTILRIENDIVNCQLDNGGIIDIARMRFQTNIQKVYVVEFDIQEYID